jgi:outer membrane protein
MLNFSLSLILMMTCPMILAQALEVNLQECFKLARERSATIAISSDQIEQAELQIKQSQASYLPVLSLQASTTQQDESKNFFAKSLTSTRQSTTNINLNQNLFQGFRDISTVNQRKNLKIGFEWAKKQAIQQLYKDVALAFYSLLIFQSDIKLYREQIQSTMRRKSELTSAKRSGRARDSDILTAESSVASLEAATSRAEGLLVTYQEAFTYLTGLTSDTKLTDNTQLPKDFKTIETWLEKLDQRPDIQQSKSNLLATEDAIKAAKSGFYPTLGLSANYYLSRPTGIFQGVDWDTSLTFSFPFFSGGLTKAQVSEASTINRSKSRLLRQTQEAAEQSIRTAFATLKSDFNLLTKLKSASDLSRRSYDLVHRDNRLGIATNTDVLTALQVWQESKRNLERARITTIFDYIKLKLETSEELDHPSGSEK